MIAIFLADILTVGINLALLYIIYLLVRKELTKKANEYLIFFIVSAIILMLFGNPTMLWPVTFAAILSMALVRLKQGWKS